MNLVEFQLQIDDREPDRMRVELLAAETFLQADQADACDSRQRFKGSQGDRAKSISGKGGVPLPMDAHSHSIDSLQTFLPKADETFVGGEIRDRIGNAVERRIKQQ